MAAFVFTDEFEGLGEVIDLGWVALFDDDLDDVFFWVMVVIYFGRFYP